jgi:putative glutamine amidotransferase
MEGSRTPPARLPGTGADPGERPLIGVTTSEMRVADRVEQTPEGEPPRPEMALGLAYLRAIEQAGGLPVVMPPLALDAVEPLLKKLAGVCLSGGPDLDPSAYRARRHPRLGPTEPELDMFELQLARRADARELPILAVCRGAQALNVARGGTLHQHLPDRAAVSLEHRQTARSDEPTHEVEVAPGSDLAQLLGDRRTRVNSFHHQAVAGLGRGLRTTAWAPDGVVEAVEAPGRDFVLGVQWHAECLTARPEQAAIFTGFVDAARRYARGRPAALVA